MIINARGFAACEAINCEEQDLAMQNRFPAAEPLPGNHSLGRRTLGLSVVPLCQWRDHLANASLAPEPAAASGSLFWRRRLFTLGGALRTNGNSSLMDRNGLRVDGAGL